jgi:hypothetical protein
VTVSFQAKKLRVQLPCGDRTVIEQEPQILCRFPSNCNLGTCGFVSPGTVACRFPTQWCDFGTPICGWCSFLTPQTCPFNSCGVVTPVCRIGTIEPTGCPVGSRDPLPIDPGTLVLDPDDLPALREQLEAQLKEIEVAERALEERRSKE